MKEIRKLIKEILGKQMEIYNSTQEITNKIVGLILDMGKNHPDIFNGEEWGFSKSIDVDDNLKNATKIDSIKINVNYINSKDSKVNGTFVQDKTVLLPNNNYSAYINVYVKINNDIKQHKKEIEDVISHELHHAFVYIKKIGTFSKASILNKTKNLTKMQLNELINDNPAIKEFMQMIYLSLPQEISARVQETATRLKYINKPNYNETIESLRKYQPLRDAKKMIDYKTDDLMSIDQEILKQFIAKFNSNLKLFSQEENIGYKTDTKAFLNYWQEKINKAGNTLFRKIMKLVADKHNTIQEMIIVEMDSKLLFEISGFDIYEN